MDSMNKQVRDLIDAGYVTRKQAAAMLFLGGDVVRLADKVYKEHASREIKDIMRGRRQYIYEDNKVVPAICVGMDLRDTTTAGCNAEMMELIYAIDAKLTALLKRDVSFLQSRHRVG